MSNNSSKVKDYILWLQNEDFPAKSYKHHPLDSVDMLEDVKTVFSKEMGISLGKYIRLKRADYILKNDNLNKQDDSNIISFSIFETPLGSMIAGATSKGLCLLEFMDRRSLESELEKIKKHKNGIFVKQESHIIKETKKQLLEYFAKERANFDIKLDMLGTEFQKQVWTVLCTIAYGETKSYFEQATRLGNVKAIRAVAGANAKNMISIIIPCHRVIGKNGKLVGYGGGIDRKRQLLALEGAM